MIRKGIFSKFVKDVFCYMYSIILYVTINNRLFIRIFHVNPELTFIYLLSWENILREGL